MHCKPLICNLSDSEFQYRKKIVVQKLKQKMLRRRSLQRGVVFYFPDDEPMLEELFAFVRSERKCCPFLQFQLSRQEPGAPIRLKIIGPPGAKEFMMAELQL